MPTETAKPRLIDANALLEEMRDFLSAIDCDKYFETRFGVRKCIELAESAPTVETTDDVIDSVGSVKFEKIATNSEPFLTMGFYASKGYEIGYGKTPLEAVKKLEESFNPKSHEK